MFHWFFIAEAKAQIRLRMRNLIWAFASANVIRYIFPRGGPYVYVIIFVFGLL